MTVILVTARVLPHDDDEAGLLLAALRARGVACRVAAWDDGAARWDDAALILLKSPWNYADALTDFMAWGRGLQAPVLNPWALVEWNVHKRYLAGMAGAVPTRVVARGEAAALRAADGDAAGRVVVKPAVGAGARGAMLGRWDDPAVVAHLAALLQRGDALVQPFVADVAAGEVSLLYFDGVFSHAVRKVPADGDYRVQVQYGGVVERHAPSPAELALGAAALAACPLAPLYARVDMVGATPLLMELEVIEPELFLFEDEGAAERLADAIVRRL
ncbi:ATP-grasp domain-containing protein [Sandaracinobacteroides saxicola]|uniref:Prokaryotic glutathione synthetase ATP-binding domain-containing protein n=1 Tax=Sandaracinobacteroides saxicola TaxID=2759707 RepID=A0A7G5ILX0_9SPHN|nr:hypothetical protein [Sandaracinobacteroides saxicola]QMW24362.1 hypothetical protein H3309_07895 [Sandaracinobacteroides saxicola]